LLTHLINPFASVFLVVISCGTEKKPNAVLIKVANQTADHFECALRLLSRPEYDKSWVAVVHQKKVGDWLWLVFVSLYRLLCFVVILLCSASLLLSLFDFLTALLCR
jgi:hypothetical protein